MINLHAGGVVNPFLKKMEKNNKRTDNCQPTATDLFAGTGGLHVVSSSDKLCHVDEDRNHEKHRLMGFSGNFKETLEKRLYELSKEPQVQYALYGFKSSISIKVEENPCPPVETFLDDLLHPQMNEPSTPLGWRNYEGAPPCPWQDDRANERSRVYFQYGAHKQIEFKNRNGVKMFLLRKEIKSKVCEICKLYHALSDRSYPPKMDYRKMKELERRSDELIEEIIGLLKEEGIFGAETVGLKVSIPAQEGVSSQGECPQSTNDASPQGEAGGKATAGVATQGLRKARGRRKRSFREAFIDVETYEREKERFINFLLKLKIAARKLTCGAKDYLNRIITCFMIVWREKGFFTEESIPGACVFRFLTEECKFKTKVSEKAYGNRMNEWIKNKNYDIKQYRKVSEAFACA